LLAPTGDGRTLKNPSPLGRSVPPGVVPTGRVRQLHRKPETPGGHGLPKTPVPEVRITVHGLAGDFNRFRHEERHDDPDMAVLIYPAETIEKLGREGWPVRPGDLGENVLTEGIAYHAFAPGLRFRIGEARVQISKACDPCDNLFLLPYVGRERGPEFLRTMLGRRGWYARVLDEGIVRTGDAIVGEPSAAP
jgi:MOSC domain-containing protein YiiM